MKLIVTALPLESGCFKYLAIKFPAITTEKIKAGIFIGPQINQLFRDEKFSMTKSMINKQTGVENFLGNFKHPDFKNMVSNMLKNFQELGCIMNVKVHFLHSHIDYFPENLGNFSEEHSE